MIELKLTKAGGLDAAEKQIRERQYAELFRSDSHKVVPLAIELQDDGKGLVSYRIVS